MNETGFFKTTAFKVIAILGGLAAFFIFGLLCLGFVFAIVYSDDPEIFSSKYDSCNVQGIKLHGTIYTYNPTYKNLDGEENLSEYEDLVASDNVMKTINTANDDSNIKAIIIEVDSSGGLPVAGEEIATAIKASEKPVISIIRQAGMSAAYWAISPSDRIFASRNSEVGSIGVTASYIQKTDKDSKYIELNSGKFKDTGNPEKLITEEERKLILRDITIIFQNFVDDVAQSRKLDVAFVKSLADGSSVLGEKALEQGLIDEIGGYNEVNTYLTSIISEKPEICW